MDFKATQPWDMLAIDTLSFLPKSQNGYRYVLGVVDVASRWLELLPLRSKDPLELAFVIEQHVFLTFGPSTSMLVPSKTEFEGGFPKILKKYNVHSVNPHGHPQLCTMASRSLSGAKSLLKEMMREFPSVPWDHLLKHVAYRFRTKKHSNMKSSPQKTILKFRKEKEDGMEVQSKSVTIRARRDCKLALAQEKNWFQSNLDRFGGLSLSLKAEVLRSKMLLDPSAINDGGFHKQPCDILVKIPIDEEN